MQSECESAVELCFPEYDDLANHRRAIDRHRDPAWFRGVLRSSDFGGHGTAEGALREVIHFDRQKKSRA